MTHKPEAVMPRWQRRHASAKYRFSLFAVTVVGEMLPGTYFYQRMVLALALQQVIHAFRNTWLRRFR